MKSDSPTSTGSYWNKTGKHQADYDRLYVALVPDTGEAQTEHGELLRAASRIYYEMFNNGGGNARVEPDNKEDGPSLDDMFSGFYNTIIEEMNTTYELADVMATCLRHLLEGKEGFNQSNCFDMLIDLVVEHIMAQGGQAYGSIPLTDYTTFLLENLDKLKDPEIRWGQRLMNHFKIKVACPLIFYAADIKVANDAFIDMFTKRVV